MVTLVCAFLGEALGLGIVYVMLGHVADILFNVAYTFVKNILLVSDGGLFTDFNFLGEASPLFNFTITSKGLIGINSGVFSAGINSSVVSLFLNLIWVMAWILFIIVSAIAIGKLILNGERISTGQGVKLLLRISVVALLLSQWYPILSNILNFITKFLNADNGYLTTSSFNDILTGYENLTKLFIDKWSYDNINSAIKDVSTLEKMSTYILAVIMEFSLGTTLLGAAMNYLERYILMAFYFYLSPLTLAMSADESMSRYIKDWFLGILPQVLGLVMNILMICLGLGVLCLETDSQSVTTTLLQGTVATACFSLTMYSDQFFEMFGIKTMTFGNTIGNILTGVGLTKKVFTKSKKAAAGTFTTGLQLIKESRDENKARDTYEQVLEKADAIMAGYYENQNKKEISNYDKAIDSMNTKEKIMELNKIMRGLSKNTDNYELVYGQLKVMKMTLQKNIDTQSINERKVLINKMNKLKDEKISDIETFKRIKNEKATIERQFNRLGKGENIKFTDQEDKELYAKTLKDFNEARKIETFREFKNNEVLYLKGELNKNIQALQTAIDTDAKNRQLVDEELKKINPELNNINESLKLLYGEGTVLRVRYATEATLLVEQLKKVERGYKDDESIMRSVSDMKEKYLTLPEEITDQQKAYIDKTRKNVDTMLNKYDLSNIIDNNTHKDLNNVEKNGLTQFKTSLVQSIINIENKENLHDDEFKFEKEFIKVTNGKDANYFDLIEQSNNAINYFGKDYKLDNDTFKTPFGIKDGYSESITAIDNSDHYALADREHLLTDGLLVVEVRGYDVYVVGYATKVVDKTADKEDGVNEITSEQYAVLTSDSYRNNNYNNQRFSENYDFDNQAIKSHFFVYNCNRIGDYNGIKSLEENGSIYLGTSLNYDKECDNFIFEKGIENQVITKDTLDWDIVDNIDRYAFIYTMFNSIVHKKNKGEKNGK